MSTFKEMCQQVIEIVGLQGTLGTVNSPIGIQRNIVEAVRSSWVDIQNLREDWTFMDGEVSNFHTVADQIVYTPTQVFGSASAALDLGTYKEKRGVFLDNEPLVFIPFEDLPFVDNTLDNQKPKWYSIDTKNNNLHLEKPDGIYNLIIRYNRTVQVLSTDTEVPIIPVMYHNAIVYKAVVRVSAFIGNSGLHQQYAVDGNRLIGDLMRTYIPERHVYPRRFI